MTQQTSTDNLDENFDQFGGRPVDADDMYGRDAALDLLRARIHELYQEEPSAKAEIAEIQSSEHLSKHQRYMQELQQSGRSLAEIQSAWHAYYTELPDDEKLAVWQEFYSNAPQSAHTTPHATANVSQDSQSVEPKPSSHQSHHVTPQSLNASAHQIQANRVPRRKRQQSVDAKAIKQRILHTVSEHVTAGGRITPKHHLQSLLFGVGVGLVVIVILMFGLFNEYVIAPFIQPSRTATETPVIVDTASTVISGGPKVLIPKINVEIPVDYSQTTTSESQIELALDNGVVHYPTTVVPGQAGNAAFFGHSSNNIFNPGKYKFAFVLLHELVEGDTFYLSYNGQTYAYRVFSKQIVSPSQVGVLQPIPGHSATATLITCDPPGTSINRLVVVGDQISPDPSGNSQPTSQPPAVTASSQPALPGNGPTLWSRIWKSVF